ncbi:hypothetical protein [Streptomyces sp. NPDC056069]|uniref:hypothetical protein n=1 Tax=Streptomyces sp. NPDC056069 TaxID=3345702 RepID=UPI0035DEB3B5
MTIIRAGGTRRRKPPAPGRRLLNRLGTLIRPSCADSSIRPRTGGPRAAGHDRRPSPGCTDLASTPAQAAAGQHLSAVAALHSGGFELPARSEHRPATPEQAVSRREAGDFTLDHLVADQLVRHADAVRLAIRRQTGTGDSTWAEARLEAARHAVDLLTAIVADHGWPSYRLIGEEASTAALLIATEADLADQVQLRDALGRAVDHGRVPPGYFSFLDTYGRIAFGAAVSPPRRALDREQSGLSQYVGAAAC